MLGQEVELRKLGSSVLSFEAEGWELASPLRALADWLEENQDAHAAAIAVHYDAYDGVDRFLLGLRVSLTAVIDSVEQALVDG